MMKTVRVACRSIAHRWLAVTAFLIGLVPCLLHNFFFCKSQIMLATDGKHFLTTVGCAVEFLLQHAFTQHSQSFLSQSDLAGHIMLDGPLMALIYAPFFVLFRKVPTPRDWLTLAEGQSIFHGASTALLALLVLRLTGSRFFALAAAIVYGLYPPAVLQSGHFMSELPVTTLLVLLLLAMTGSKGNIFSWLVAGIAAGAVALTKPALIPGVALAVLLALFREAAGPLAQGNESVSDPQPQENEPAGRPDLRRLKNTGKRLLQIRTQLSSLIIGFALVLTPWGLFSIAATGHFVPTPQRLPLYNVVKGWNTEANGWGYSPHPPLTDLFTEADGPLPAAAGIWMSRPQESACLAFSKLSRLASCPWNDFKGRALGLDESAQIIVQRLIIAFAAFGVGIFLFSRRRYLQYDQCSILLIAIALIAGHLGYLMVECLPRYTYTAMPFAVLLAIYGIWQASQLSFQDKLAGRIIICSAAFASIGAGLLIHAEDLCRLFDRRALFESAHVVHQFERVEKQIDLGSLRVPAHIKAAILMIDGDKELEKCKVVLNGRELKGRLLSTTHFDPRHYAMFDLMREFAPAMRVSVDDFRQWRAIPVEPGLINWQGRNRIVLTGNEKAVTVYGDRCSGRYSLSPDYCNYGILSAAPIAAGVEPRYTDPVIIAASKQSSELIRACSGESNKNSLPGEGNQTSKETLKDSLRVRFLVILANAAEACGSSIKVETAGKSVIDQAGRSLKTESASRTVKVARESFDRLLWDTSSNDCLRINKAILYAARTIAGQVPLPELEASSHVHIKVTGELKSLKRNAGEVGLLCVLRGSNEGTQILGKTPRALLAARDWQKFQIDDVIPLADLGGKAKALELAFYPCPWMEGQYGVSRQSSDAVFRNLVVEASSTELPSLSGPRIIY